MSIQPKAARVRKLVRFLSFGGVCLFVASMLLFGYVFETSDNFGGPPPDYYSYLGWTSIYGGVIGPISTIGALLIAVFCKIKKI